MISELELSVLYEIQRLPLCVEPFRAIANRLGIGEGKVLDIASDLQNRGVIRRIGASVSHRKLGVHANPMTVIKVPQERVEEVGNIIASEKGVTHCYAREGWDYNLFFMTHSKTREEAFEKVKKIMDKTGIEEFKLLYSTRELKKVSFEVSRPDTHKIRGLEK